MIDDSPGSQKMSEIQTGRWILAIGKHLKTFASNQPQLTYLFATQRSAKEGELLLRIRGLTVVRLPRLEALALDAGIPRQELPTVLQQIEGITGLISIAQPSASHTIEYVNETILTEQEVYRAVSSLFEASDPDPAERAIIPLLELMSRLPLTESELFTHVCARGFTEADVQKALELQEAFQLSRRQSVTDLGITLLYNEYLWGSKIERIGSLLTTLGSREKEHLLNLIEEVRTVQGQSLDRLTSAPQHIVELAARTGIIDTTTISTTSGDEKSFAFSPHFYGYRTGPQPEKIQDDADQVKLFVASIAYGTNHSSDFRLYAPIRFVEQLYQNREAGSATPILRDYPLLERQGIVTVEERTPGRGTFVLQKPDVVRRALDVMKSGSLLVDRYGRSDTRTLVSQRNYRSPEHNRIIAQMGQVAGDTRRFDEELLASIRETAQRGGW